VADAAAGVADAVRRAVIGRFPDGPTTNKQPVAGPPPREIAAVLARPGMNGWMNQQTMPASPWRQLGTIMVAIARSRSETVTATRTGLRGVADDVAGGAAAAADAATMKAMSAPGRRQTAKAVNGPMMRPMVHPASPIGIMTTSRCPLDMACGHPRGRHPTLVGRSHPGMKAASPLARPEATTASLANLAAAADAVGGAAKDAAAMPAAPQHRQRVAARVPHHAVRVKAVRVKKGAGVAGVAAGARGTNVVLPRPWIAVAVMNLPPSREGVRRTTRAWNSSGSRMRAMKAAAATTVIQRMTMTASSRAVSTRCSMCRAGWRRLASSSLAISTPAADRPVEEMVVVVAGNREATPRRGAAHRTGLATPAAAAARAISGKWHPWPNVCSSVAEALDPWSKL
jgi:hypothetical protein